MRAARGVALQLQGEILLPRRLWSENYSDVLNAAGSDCNVDVGPEEVPRKRCRQRHFEQAGPDIADCEHQISEISNYRLVKSKLDGIHSEDRRRYQPATFHEEVREGSPPEKLLVF